MADLGKLPPVFDDNETYKDAPDPPTSGSPSMYGLQWVPACRLPLPPPPPPPPPPPGPYSNAPPALPLLTYSKSHAHYREALTKWQYRIVISLSGKDWPLSILWTRVNDRNEPIELQAIVYPSPDSPHPPGGCPQLYKPMRIEDLWDIYKGHEPSPAVISMLSPIERKALNRYRAGANDPSIGSQSALSDTESANKLLHLISECISDAQTISSDLDDPDRPSIYESLIAQFNSRPLESSCAIAQWALRGSEIVRAPSESFELSEPPSIAPPSTSAE